MQFSDFARRYQGNSGTLQLMDDLGKALSGEIDMHMLGGGNPAHILEVENRLRTEMLSIANNPQRFADVVGNYDGPQGDTEFIATLVDFLNGEYDWGLTPENVALTNGSQSSFGLIFNLLAGQYSDDQGHHTHKKILLPLTPEYIGYSDVSLQSENLFEARKPHIEKLDNGFFKYHVDFDGLEIDAARHAAVCVSRPTNPTGNVISDNALQRLDTMCRAAGVPLIVDGAYGVPFPNILFTEATPHWNPNTILCLSLSKLGLPGVRTGIVIAATPLIELIKSANAIQSLAPGSFGPSLVTNLLRSSEIKRLSNEVIQPYYRKKMQFAVDVIQQNQGDLPVYIHQPEGALFLWLWFEGLPTDSEALYQQLKQNGVLVIAGQHFYPGLDDDNWAHRHECIRVSYAGESASVKSGIELILQTLAAHY